MFTPINNVLSNYLTKVRNRTNIQTVRKRTNKIRIMKGGMAKPEEVAKLVAFLSSDDAEFIDGEVIKIDGGYKLM